jgi:hypothetical protein
MKRFGVLSALALALLAAACGEDEEGIVLEIDSPLQIPDQIDGLVISVANQEGGKLGEVTEALTEGQKFPLTKALVPSASTPELIVVHVTGTLGAPPVTVAEREVEVEWVKGHVAYATVDLISTN